MRKVVEKLAVGAVILLSMGTIIFIIQYNMIGSGSSKTLTSHKTDSSKTMSKEEKTNSYLNSLEGYEEVDVKASKQEGIESNQVSVKPELPKNKIDQALNQVNEKNRGLNIAIDTALDEI